MVSLALTETDDPVRVVLALLVALVVAAVGLGGGTVLVLVVAFAARAAGVELTPIRVLVASLVLMQGVAFGSVALGYLGVRRVVRSRLDDRSPAASVASYLGVRLPSVRELLVAVVGYVLALGAAMTGGVLVSLTGVESGTNQVAEIGFEHPEVLLLLIPASFVLIGPGEELLFRGVVQNRIREALGPVPGVFLASLIFASIHFVALTGGVGARLVAIGVLLFPSLVFGSVYEYTHNLVVPALVHGAYNATLFSLLYVVLRLSEVAPAAPGPGPGM